MKNRLSFFILITLLLATASTVFAESEPSAVPAGSHFVYLPMIVTPPQAPSEPNDSFAMAAPIDVGLSQARTEETLIANDYDYFYFTAVAGRTYVIETYNIQGTPGGAATGLWLYNNSQTEIDHDAHGDNGTGNANARIVYTFSTTGTYYILAKDCYYCNWTGSYALHILPKYNEPGAAWNANNDNEPNDNRALANEIEVGLSNAQTHQFFNHASYVTNDSDYDYYRFEAAAGRTYVIETYNIQGALGGAATGLWLYDSSGTLILDDRHGDNGTGNANARLVYTFSTSGTYFVLVKDCYYCTWTGTYSLRVLPKYNEPGAEWDENNDYEPNDARVLANEMEVGLSNAQTHQLFNYANNVTNDSDYDFYHFEAEAGLTYVIETYNIQGTTDEATGLWLYDSSGTAIVDDRHGDNGSGNANARLVYTFSTTGTYFVLVKDCYYCTWTGIYSIRILPKYDEPGAEWGADSEPNDAFANAYSIGIGPQNAQTHELFDNSNIVSPRSDFDYYHFTAEAGQTYVIQTFNIQATSSATGLWLYNSSGTELISDPHGNNQTGEAEITYTFTTAGEYIILVKDCYYCTWTGSYAVQVYEGLNATDQAFLQNE